MPNWKPTVIQRIVRIIESSTCPAQVRTDAGGAYVKVPDNPSGPHALVCELVGTRLAAWLGLATFDLALIDYPGVPRIEFADGRRARPGTALAAREVVGTPWGEDRKGLELVANPTSIAGLVLFDTWTLNRDRYFPQLPRSRRNLNNVFLSEDEAPARRYHLLAMDHTECFRENSGDLSRKVGRLERVRERRVHGLFREFVPYVTEDAVAPFIERLRLLRATDVAEIVDAVPRDWELTADIAAALRDLIVDRARFVSDNLLDMLAAPCGWPRSLLN